MKKFAALMIALILALSCFAVAEEESYTIGIAQFAEHGSLDNCREGFLAGLAEDPVVKICRVSPRRNEHNHGGAGLPAFFVAFAYPVCDLSLIHI